MENKKRNRILLVVGGILVLMLFIYFGFLKISGFSVNDDKDEKIIAMVDFGLYEPGDTTMTIYGACLDSDNHPVSSTAKLTIYDDSGTYLSSTSMTALTTGRFNYSANAPSAEGNYFVEINCSTGSAWALAHDNIQVKNEGLDMQNIVTGGTTLDTYQSAVSVSGKWRLYSIWMKQVGANEGYVKITMDGKSPLYLRANGGDEGYAPDIDTIFRATSGPATTSVIASPIERGFIAEGKTSLVVEYKNQVASQTTSIRVVYSE